MLLTAIGSDSRTENYNTNAYIENRVNILRENYDYVKIVRLKNEQVKTKRAE